MLKRLYEFLSEGIVNMANNTLHQVREINKKYKVPHTKTTPAVKFSLLMLRFYLLGLIAILLYKFITLLGA